jgi:acetyl esterase
VIDKVYHDGIVDPPILAADLLKGRADEARGGNDVLVTIPLTKVEDREISGTKSSVKLKLRIYRPVENGILPTVLFLHGGGFVQGSVNSYDSLTREFAQLLPAVVVSVSYRLAPESPYPAAIDDSFEALKWVKRHMRALGNDPNSLIVMGDSAGGDLAGVVARKAANAKIPVRAQLLIYPVTDTTDRLYESILTYGQGYFLTNTGMQSYRNFYLPNQKDWTAPDAAPMNASKSELSDVAPAYFLLAGCDPLYDEGLAYARKLHAAGIPVIVQWENGMTHGFLGSFNNPHDVELGKEATPIYHRMISEVAALIAGKSKTETSKRVLSNNAE